MIKAKTKRVFAVFMIILTLCGVLSGCAMLISPKSDLEAIISAWQDMDTEKMFDLLYQDDEVSLDRTQWTQRMETIWDALGVYEISVEPGESQKDGDTLSVPVTVTYFSGLLQQFQFDAVATLTLVEKTWRLNWDYGLLLPEMRQSDKVSLRTLHATRGEIFTADRLCVAKNIYAPTVYARPEKIEDESAFAQQLAPVLDMQAEEIIDILHSDATARDSLAVFKVYSPADENLDEVIDAVTSIKGAGVDQSFMSPARLYPIGEDTGMLAHLVGYAAAITKEEYDEKKNEGYFTSSIIGKRGLEMAYEDVLRGINGYELSLLDENGNSRVQLARKEPVAGEDLTLSIDSQIQRTAERELKERLTDTQAGSVIVLDPKSGYVLAMASYPTFDPNFFSLTATIDAETRKELWASLNDEKGRPMYARTTQGLYAPGSTFKPFTAAAALETGTMTKDYVFSGTINNNRWRPNIAGWNYPAITRYRSYQGAQNMSNALINSDNIYFANAAMMVGEEKFIEMIRRIGFTERMPFDVAVQQGQLSNAEDRLSIENIKHLADCGYGQSEMLIAPLQMAAIFSSYANDGDIMQPRAVAHTDRMVGVRYARIQDFEPTVWKKDVIEPSTIGAVLPMLIDVTASDSGTAQTVRIPSMDIAGKTGTAEVGNERQISWFIGFNTKGDEDRLVCITLEVEANRGAACNLIAREMFLADAAGTVTGEGDEDGDSAP
ncbi:MAG: penicillin-binding transpeptidase domain-containing protein [Christensenellales bacterium]|jgi:cell division protein FtsI/penicillin-binding protein 2